jgi:hypothetical protein
MDQMEHRNWITQHLPALLFNARLYSGLDSGLHVDNTQIGSLTISLYSVVRYSGLPGTHKYPSFVLEEKADNPAHPQLPTRHSSIELSITAMDQYKAMNFTQPSNFRAAIKSGKPLLGVGISFPTVETAKKV